MLNNFIKYLVITSFCLLSSQVLAQEKYLNGMIVVDFNDDYPQGVVITNKRTKVYSISDITGSFKVHAQVGDTLLFQAPFLVDRKFVVRASTFDLYSQEIYLEYVSYINDISSDLVLGL